MTDGTSLIVGADSRIGSALYAALIAGGRSVLGTTRRTPRPAGPWQVFDLNADAASWELPAGLSTAYLCAAVTKLEDCRLNPRGSRRINVEQTVTLARKLVAQNGFVVFLSTNLVFDGRTARTPADAVPNPQTEYGRQKAAAEQALLELGDAVAVVRLSKVVPPRWPLLVDWAAQLRRGETIRPFSDVRFSPVPLESAVELIRRIGERRVPGIFQWSGKDDVTYEEAGRWLARRDGVPERLVQGIAASEAGQDYEAIPRHTTLDSRRAGEEFRIHPPDVWTTLEACLEPPAIVKWATREPDCANGREPLQ